MKDIELELVDRPTTTTTAASHTRTNSSTDMRNDPEAGVNAGEEKCLERNFTDDKILETGETEKKDEEHCEYITGFKLFAMLISVALAAFLMLLDASIIGVAIPIITSRFHSLDDVGWYTSAYQLASASLQPLSGKIYSSFSTKWAYMIFFALFELGSLICGLANSSIMLIVGRALAGMGSSGLLNGGMTMIAGAVPLEKRPVYTGMYLGISQLGIVCGPLIGGALTEYTTWRWCFYINLPAGAVVAVLLLFLRVPDITVKPPFSMALVRETIPKLDLVGFALFAPATIMVLLAMQYGGKEYAWNSSVVIGLFVGSGLTAIVFGFWEKRMGPDAMIPLSMVKNRIVWTSALNGATVVAAILTASQYLPIYFQGVRGYGPALSGVNTLPGILSQLVFVILTGVMVPKIGYYLPFALVGAAISAIGNGIVSMFDPHTPTGKWIGYQIVLGTGRGIAMQIGIIAIQNCLAPHLIPVGVAFQIFCQNFAGAIFVEVAEAIFTHQLVDEIKRHAPGVSTEAATAVGASASAVRKLAPPGSKELAGVLLAFANSVDKVFIMLMAISLLGFLSAFGMGWVDIRKKVSKTDPKKVEE